MCVCMCVCVCVCVCVCMCVCVCLPVCLSSLVCMVGVIFVWVDIIYEFYGYAFLCLVGCFSLIIWTTAVLSVLYACVLHFCICTCSAQLSMFHMERRFRNTLISISIIIIINIFIAELFISVVVYIGSLTQRTTSVCGIVHKNIVLL